MSNQTSIHPYAPPDSASPQEHHRFMTRSGLLGLVASAAYITTLVATNVLGSVEPADGPDDIIRYLQDVADNDVRSYVYGIAGIVMSVLFLPFTVAVYSKLKRGSNAALGSLAMAVGLMMLIPAYAVSILEAAALAPVATDLGANGTEALWTLQEFGVVTAGIFFTVGSVLTLCVAPMLWAIDGRRTRTLPTWITTTGLLVGGSGVIWFFWLFSESPIILIILLVNVIASIVFFIALSRQLLKA